MNYNINASKSIKSQLNRTTNLFVNTFLSKYQVEQKLYFNTCKFTYIKESLTKSLFGDKLVTLCTHLGTRKPIKENGQPLYFCDHYTVVFDEFQHLKSVRFEMAVVLDYSTLSFAGFNSLSGFADILKVDKSVIDLAEFLIPEVAAFNGSIDCFVFEGEFLIDEYNNVLTLINSQLNFKGSVNSTLKFNMYNADDKARLYKCVSNIITKKLGYDFELTEDNHHQIFPEIKNIIEMVEL